MGVTIAEHIYLTNKLQ